MLFSQLHPHGNIWFLATLTCYLYCLIWESSYWRTSTVFSMHLYRSLAKEHPRTEYLTTPPKRGVGVSVSAFNYEVCPCHVYSNSMLLKQNAQQNYQRLWSRLLEAHNTLTLLPAPPSPSLRKFDVIITSTATIDYTITKYSITI